MNNENPLPRYLVPFSPKTNPHLFTDVLIIGGGIAGLRAALEIDPSLQVTIITKGNLSQSNSSYAQGGIAGVLDSADQFQWHTQDTLDAGGNLCHKGVVEDVIRQAPERIEELIRWGTKFDQTDGELNLGREGGHSHHRIVHAMGDSTGQEMMRAVIGKVLELPNVNILQDGFTIDLITQDGRCLGALTSHQGQVFQIWAKQTILCTGGAGQLFRETTNPPVATADGHAIALRAGVKVRDMEFMQFHPTVLYIAGGGRNLITEAVRGEGAYLIDNIGHRFMPDYDSRAELAPRDVVSQSIEKQIDKTKDTNVYLDLSHLDPEAVRKRFPGMTRVCSEFGIDVTSDRIPVRPGAHYMIGGVEVDLQGRTNIEGLWAAGEVTSSGLHGANRLASNSLLEGLVYGMQAGQQASEEALKTRDEQLLVPRVISVAETERPLPLDVTDVLNSLRSQMWRSVGVRRDEEGLQTAARQIEKWAKYIHRHQFKTQQGWQLQNMLGVAAAVTHSALLRTESRGVHYRSDFSDCNDEQWKAHICIQNGKTSIQPLEG